MEQPDNNDFFAGFEVAEKVGRGRSNTKWESYDVFRAFVSSGNVCMKKDFGEDAQDAYGAYKGYAKTHPEFNVMVNKRGTFVYFTRTDM